MKHTIFTITWCISSMATAFPDHKHDVRLKIPWQQKNLAFTARDHHQNPRSVILPRSPTSRSAQNRSGQRSSRPQNQSAAPRTQSPGSSNSNPGRGQRQARERTRSPARGRDFIRNNSPAQINASNQPGSPIRSNASNRSGSLAGNNSSNRGSSPARSQSPNRATAPAQSRSQSPAGLGSISQTDSSSSQSQSSARSTSSRSGSVSSRSSGPSEFPVGPQGEIPFPHNVIPPTKAAGMANGPAILTKHSPFLGSDGGVIPSGVRGQTRVVNPYKSKVAGIARHGVSLALAEGDTASARIRTGPNSWGILTATTPEGQQVIHVYPNSRDRIRAQTNEPGLTPARATVQLVGEGTFRARGRNLRRRALSRFDS